MDVEVLSQLISIVTRNKLKSIDTNFYNSNERTKIFELYEDISDSKLLDEQSIMYRLYGNSIHDKLNYHRLKRQLSDKLVDLLFLIDSSKSQHNNIAEAYDLCHKYYAAVKMLSSRRARKASAFFSEKTYKIAEKYEFTDILLGLSKELRAYYAIIGGNKRKYLYYNDKTSYYSKLYFAELKAEEFYSQLVIMVDFSKSNKIAHKESIKAFIRSSFELMSKYSSYRLNLYSYAICAIGYELLLDYEKTILTCDEALRYFKKNKHLSNKIALFTFNFRKISCLFLLGNKLKAYEVAKKCLTLEDVGSPNWYKLQSYNLIVCLHLSRYEEAYITYKATIDCENFSKQSVAIKEPWLVNEAYIYYLCLRQVINTPLNKRLKKFRLNKFLNEVPNYSKDKRGMNISILIIQVLFLLHQKKYGKIIDRTEALQVYTHRYLRKDATFRSNCFIKMLLQLPKANFHRVAVERKTAELRKKLSSVGIIHNQSAEVEIIPYEVLWELALDSLDNKIWHK